MSFMYTYSPHTSTMTQRPEKFTLPATYSSFMSTIVGFIIRQTQSDTLYIYINYIHPPYSSYMYNCMPTQLFHFIINCKLITDIILIFIFAMDIIEHYNFYFYIMQLKRNFLFYYDFIYEDMNFFPIVIIMT